MDSGMIICPDCGYENLPGADQCEQCQQSLVSETMPRPASAVERHIAKDRIELLNPKQPFTVPPDTPVGNVLKTLVDKAIGCVIVVDGEETVGIFSERDALMRLNTDAEQFADRPVSEFMTPAPQVLEAKDKIAFALHRMDLGGYRHIPILEKGRTTGIISVRDILRYVTERLAEPG